MRERQVVQFVSSKETRVPYMVKDRWEFKPSGRLAPVLRWVWRFLLWRGALFNCIDEKVTITRHVIDDERFMDRLFKQKHGLLDVHREPKTLLIGSEDYAEMMNAPEMSLQMFNFSGAYWHGERGQEPRMCGLDVRVIPWMRGFLVMP